MLSWFKDQQNCYCCIWLVIYIIHLHWWCTVKHKSNPVLTVSFIQNTLNYLLTYYTEQSPSCKANQFSASQEIPRILCNPKVYYLIRKCLPPIPTLSNIDPVRAPTSHFLKINLNIILPSTPASSEWSLSFGFPHQNPVLTCPFLRSYQSISPGPRSSWTVRNMIRFHGVELLAHRPTPKLEDQPLSAVHDWNLNIFTCTLHIGGRSSTRNPRTRHAMLTGTHLLWIKPYEENNIHFFTRVNPILITWPSYS